MFQYLKKDVADQFIKDVSNILLTVSDLYT